MSVPIPAGVQCSYNGITFPANIKTKVDEAPVESGDGRVIKYSRLTFSISGYVTQEETGDMPLDALMRTWRTSLQKNGKNLQYVNKGYGIDLNINAAGNAGVRDVAMGPKAGKFTWTPLGGAPVGCMAARFSWSVSTCIPECTTATYLPGKGVFSEISFTIAYAQDEAGLTTRTTSGTIEIPLSLQSDNTLSTNIDQFFADAIKLPPDGFIRTANRQLSADRRSCTFSLVDKQIESCFPNYVVLMNAEHRVRDMGSKGGLGLGLNWDCTFSGTVRMSPSAPRSFAFTQFWGIVYERIYQTRKTPGLTANGATTGKNCVVTPPICEFTETIFKNESRFSVKYKIMGGATLRNIFEASGLWRPIGFLGGGFPGAPMKPQFSRWARSLRDDAQQTGGISQSRLLPSQDAIIDVCNSGADGGVDTVGADSEGDIDFAAADAEEVAFASEFEPITLMGPAPGDGDSSSSGVTSIAFIGPDDITSTSSDGVGEDLDSGVIAPAPESSWLNWTCTVERATDFKMIRHKPLSGKTTIDVPEVDPLGDVDDVAGDDAPPSAGFTSSVADIIQQVAAPSITLHLIGNATRLLYRVNPPKLISFGGVAPVLAHEQVRETTLSSPGGLTLYRTDWALTYLVASPPQTIGVPANPFLGISGQE
jgi:hypothetical protein